MKSHNSSWVLGALIDSYLLSRHQSYPVIACILEFLLLQLMLLQTTVHLLYFTTLGTIIAILIFALLNYLLKKLTTFLDNMVWQFFFHNRASPCEFVIPLAKYNKAMYAQVSLGMRFRMMFETEDSGVRRYMGTITGVSDLDTVRWKSSQWRNLQVLFHHVNSLYENFGSVELFCVVHWTNYKQWALSYAMRSRI